MQWAAVERPARQHSLDALRIAAAAGIVWFHADPHAQSAHIGNAGLPVFLLLVGYAVANTARRRPLGEYVQERARRLLVPFAAWYAAYCIEVAVVAGPEQLAARLTLSPLATVQGPALHLWLLLFAFGISALAALALRPVVPGRTTFSALGAGALAVLGAQPALAPPEPIAQWWYALPAVLVGLALGHAEERERRWLSVLLGAGVLAVCALTYPRSPGAAVEYAIGCTLAIAATQVRIPPVPAIARGAELTLGVYVLHPAVFTACHVVGLGGFAERFVIGLLGSAAATAVLRRTTLGQRIV